MSQAGKLPTWAELKKGLDAFTSSFGGAGGSVYVCWLHQGKWIEIQAESIEAAKTRVLAKRILLGTWPVQEQSAVPKEVANEPSKPIVVQAKPNPYSRKFA